LDLKKIKDLLSEGEKILLAAGLENCRGDAETLLGHETGMDKKDLFLNRDSEVDDKCKKSYFELIRRRASREPLQYITGEQYFMGHRFSVDPSVLIPRPETEILAEKVIEYLRARNDAKTVLDLCTGSGALAISIAIACPDLKVTASDVSPEALAVAKRNANELGVSSRVSFIESDLFAACTEKYDLIVTNPPYIRTGDLAGLAREISAHEPLSALDGGDDGLDFYRRIAEDARAHMSEEACLMAEIGADQAEDAAAVFSAAGFTVIEIIQDLSNRDRIIRIT